MSNEQLANRLTIAEVVRVYDEATAKIRGAFAQVSAAEQQLNDTFAMGDYMSTIHVNRHGRIDFDRPDDVLIEIRHQVWSAIVERLEVRRMMSIARWKELQRQIEKKELPEITHESVGQLTSGFEKSLSAMLGEAVEEVFDWLRPRRSDYKTNSELEIGRKVILAYVVEHTGYGRSNWRVSYHYDQNLLALENVLHALDGRGQISKTHYSAIHNVVEAEGFDGVGETDLFKFKCYRNRNLHIEFKRLDLLAKFNRIAGGHRLRPATAAE